MMSSPNESFSSGELTVNNDSPTRGRSPNGKIGQFSRTESMPVLGSRRSSFTLRHAPNTVATSSQSSPSDDAWQSPGLRKNFDWSHLIGSYMSLEWAQSGCTIVSKIIEICFTMACAAVLTRYVCHAAIIPSQGTNFKALNLPACVAQPLEVFKNLGGVPPLVAFFACSATLASLFFTTAFNTLVSPSVSHASINALDLTNRVTRSALDPTLMSKDSVGPKLLVSSEGMTDFVNWNESLHDEVTGARPNPQTNWKSQSTVSGMWMSNADHPSWGRPVSNATLVYPHIGLARLTSGEENRQRLGLKAMSSPVFEISTDVISPAVNAICTKLSTEEAYVWNYFVTDFVKATNSSSGAATDADHKVMTDLLSSGSYKSLEEISHVFGWDSVDNLPGKLSEEILKSQKVKISPAVYEPDRSVERPVANYIQVSFGSCDPGTNVVCNVQPAIVNKCTSTYHGETGNNRMSISCPTDAFLTHDKSYSQRWATLMQDILRDQFSNSGQKIFANFMGSCPTLANLTSTNRDSMSEALAVLAGPLGVRGSGRTSMKKLSGEASIEQPFDESIVASVRYSTYRSGGSMNAKTIWPIILYASLVLHSLQSAGMIIFIIFSRKRELIYLEGRRNLFQIALTTHFDEEASPEEHFEKFNGRWAIARRQNGTFYAFQLSEGEGGGPNDSKEDLAPLSLREWANKVTTSTGEFAIPPRLLNLLGQQEDNIYRNQGFKACTIDANTRFADRNLFKDISAGTHSHIPFEPEQVVSDQIKEVMKDAAVNNRVGRVATDEAHLLTDWKDFQEDYKSYHAMRTWILFKSPMSACFATMPRAAEREVRNMAGLRKTTKCTFIKVPKVTHAVRKTGLGQLSWVEADAHYEPKLGDKGQDRRPTRGGFQS
ncbi:hypothetical protein KEM56_001006 [Ascosphaera pollenicola]|nr:hypothetical protein KEM56_001006 [Ascosphaera pollenicola]